MYVCLHKFIICIYMCVYALCFVCSRLQDTIRDLLVVCPLAVVREQHGDFARLRTDRADTIDNINIANVHVHGVAVVGNDAKSADENVNISAASVTSGSLTTQEDPQYLPMAAAVNLELSFEFLEQRKACGDVVNYAIAQTSLEQIFVKFAGEQIED